MSVKQLRLLLVKEFTVMWRSKVWTLVEIAVPLLISLPIVIFVVQESSSVKHEAQFWEPFRVTGDWRDVDRRVGRMQSIYGYCGVLNQRSLGLVFPSNMDRKEILWAVREIESRYLMNSSTLHAHDYKLNVRVFSSEAAMMETLLKDYNQSFRCTNFIAGIIFHDYNISASRLSYTVRIRQTEDLQTRWYIGDDIWGNGGPYEVLEDEFPVNIIPNYWSLGFLSLQYAINSVFLKGIDGGKFNDRNFDFSLERMPEPSHSEQTVARFLSFLMLFWPLFALPCILHTTANIASEKDSGMKTVSSSLFVIATLLYGAGAVSFALLVSSIFHSPGAATKGAIMIWLVIIGLTKFQPSGGSIFVDVISSLNVNSAFMFALKAVQDHMNRDEYLSWSNMFENATYLFPFGLTLGMMTFDVIWMLLLAFYLDNVYPCGHSPRKHWLYFIPFSNKEAFRYVSSDLPDAPNDNVQEHEGSDQADIDVRHLTKKYTALPAVDNMSFRAYRGEVTVLLGHNGAGKSTTFSMITGLIAPTTGSIYICGNRLESRSIDYCQREIGFCPQYNALFNLLTVREHLEMFRKLRGNPVDCVDQMIKDVQLEKSADVVVKKLSGGMKRKLCVGMSLIGGSRVVLLDEPTVGMDPASRHAIAQLLERFKRERTILLTTHYMDEADSLGDRIAIMAKGQLVCAGTSAFLKSRFGTGYLLSIDLMRQRPRFCRRDMLLDAIREYIPKIRVQSATAQQLTVLLPSENKNSFPSLFAYLEENGEKYGINSFGLSLNALEQVFLRVEELGESNSVIATDVEDVAKLHASGLCEDSPVRTGVFLWFGQLCALLRKRYICYLKQWPWLIWQIFVPITVLLLTVLYMKNLLLSVEEKHEIQLNAGRITASVVPVQSENPETAVFNIRHIVENITGYSYREVPPSEDMARYLSQMPKKPPPVSTAVTSDVRDNRVVVTAFFNAKARYGPVITTSLISNARLGLSADSIRLSFSPYGNVSNLSPLASLSSEMVLVAPILIIAFAFISSGFVIFIADDLSTKFLYQQLYTGLRPFTYWISVLISDSILYALTCVFLMLIIVLVGKWLTTLVFDMALLWLLYLWPTMPFVYCMAFLFMQPTRAYILLIIIKLVLALCAVIITNIAISMKPEFFPYLHTAFLLTLPTYGMSFGLVLVLMADATRDTSDLYSWEKLGRVYVMMACSGLLFWVALFLINFKPLAVYMHDVFSVVRKTSTSSLRHENDVEDVDVMEERDRIRKKKNSELSLVVRALNKYYGSLCAVRDLTFGIECGECFGLLGVNGAGKTTTFDMLTGMYIPDGGEAFINGRSVLKKQIIGFCPQFDALHPELTARQTLQLLASLHGYVNSVHRVSTVLEAVSLTPHDNIRVKFFSGGQRRRLSLAVALISQVDLILLDEPTAGIDPKGRRQIWNLLSAMREERRAMLLTSHSLNECEALCTRIGIMDRGALIAIGTPQHIKTRFGEKYTLSITISDENRRAELIDAVGRIFPGSIEKSIHRTHLLWDIIRTGSDRWSEMYEKVCQLATQCPWIIDYSLAQASLEEAFLRLSQLEKNNSSETTASTTSRLITHL